MKKIQISHIREMMYRAYKKGAINLSQGTPGFDTPEHIKQAAIKALKEGYTQYTPLTGYPELRQEISKKLKSYNKINADPETEILVTAGTIEGLAASVLSLIEKGDEVISFGPVFASYRAMAEIAEGKLKEVPLRGENLEVDLDMLQKNVGKKTKMIILNTPHNPSGKVFTKEELRGIADIAIDKNLIVLTDEIYEYLLFEGKHYSIGSFVGMEDRTITASGFSKTYAMTGWRVGYLAGNKKFLETITNVHTHIVICAPSISQWAALAALRGPQGCVEEMRLKYKENRDLIVPRLNKLGFKCFNPQGAYYVFANATQLGMNGLEVAELLIEKANVAIVPGVEFGQKWKNWVRFSFARSKKEIETALRNIEKCF